MCTGKKPPDKVAKHQTGLPLTSEKSTYGYPYIRKHRGWVSKDASLFTHSWHAASVALCAAFPRSHRSLKSVGLLILLKQNRWKSHHVPSALRRKVFVIDFWVCIIIFHPAFTLCRFFVILISTVIDRWRGHVWNLQHVGRVQQNPGWTTGIRKWSTPLDVGPTTSPWGTE